ncbi:MAG: MarR family transcriptional regulator [Acidimicrobiia bacterium]|nr:MarR family transcriptional regulator [Acidimicrobiia bacterium]
MNQDPPESARHAARLGVPDAGPAMTMASLLWKASSELSSYMSSAWTTPDLRAGEADVLMALRVRDEVTTTPADLKARFNLTSAGITSRLDLLETKALLERKPHPTDRRSVTLHLTGEGERIADETIVAVATTMSELTTDVFTDRDVSELSRQLGALLERLQGNEAGGE